MVPLQAVELKSESTTTPFGVLHSRTGRQAPASFAAEMILVHGMVLASTYMVPLARYLASLCRVHVLDLPGFGKSHKPKSVPDLPQLADTIAAWMDAKHISRAHLIGNSFGCQILAEFALRHPERTQRLVLQGPTVDPNARKLSRQLFRFMINAYHEASYGSASLGWIMMKDYARTGFKRSLEVLTILLRDEIENKLPKINAPTLVVRGSKDPIVPSRWAEQVAKLLPRGELKVIPGGSHTLNYIAPLEMVRVTRPFLQI
jgi:2-hydroxy-6-oxonona-2,4-dienedioate hydrolase